MINDETRARLEQLAEREDIDAILQLVGPEEIARAWCRHRLRAESGELPIDDDNDPDWWSVEIWLSERWSLYREEIRRALHTLVEEVPEDMLNEVGAGPLEDYLTSRDARADDVVAWVEANAAASQRFRRALGFVRVFGVLPDALADRVERAARVSLPRPQR